MDILKKIIQNKLTQSKDAKILLENFFSLSALKLLGYIFPLITLPYLARVIGVDKFGEIAFAAAIIIYFQTFIDFGFDYTAVRDIAKCRGDMSKIHKIFTTIMVAKMIFMFFSFVLMGILILIIPSFYENRILLLFTFLYIPGHILFPDWFFQAMEEMKFITVLNLLTKLLFTALVFIFIKEKSDYIIHPLLNALGYLLSGIISIPLIINKYKVKLILPTFRGLINAIRESWNMFIVLFLPNLYTSFSIVLLRMYSGTTAIGLYTSGSKFIELVDQFSSVISRTFYPFLARRLDKHNIFVLISFIISIISGLFLLLGADILIRIFYTNDFAESAKIIRIMSLCPFFLFLMNTYGPNYLVLINKENILRNIIIFCSVGGFFISWIMVSSYSYIGIALSITIIWGIRGFLTWFYANRHMNRNAK